MSTQALSAATQDRKARLAQLKSLKRKQAPDGSPQEDDAAPLSPSKATSTAADDSENPTSQYLSGRNYDSATRGPKLGYDAAPDEGQDTVEARAAALELDERTAREKEAADDAPLDLAKLQPKRANWDLKRDLKEANKVLEIRTENAFARALRRRIREESKAAENGSVQDGPRADGDGEGVDLAAVAQELEKEDEHDAADSFW